MSERKKIEDRLRKKEQEISNLDEKIKAAKVYVQALKDILKILDKDETGPESDGDTVLRRGSAVAQARKIIAKQGQPVHINDILEAMGKDVTRDTKASLTSSLAAYVRRGEIFTRPAPNTFGLSELGHEAVNEFEDIPPPDFGKEVEPDPSDDDDIPF